MKFLFAISIAAALMVAPATAKQCGQGGELSKPDNILRSLEVQTEMKCPLPQKLDQPHSTMATSGCCSYHGGVCGCGGFRITCCDGASSPTCGC